MRDYIKELNIVCNDYDLVLSNNADIDRPATGYSLWTIDDPSVGIFSAQVSPWFPSVDGVYFWWRLMKEMFRG